MRKKALRWGILLVLSAMIGIILAMPASGAPAPAFNTFNNPNYIYSYVKLAPDGVKYRQAGLSPDGTKIVATRQIRSSPQPGWYEVVLMNADGSEEIVISPGDSGTGDIYEYTNPFWSDDGTVIGFAEVHNNNPNKIVAYDISNQTRSYIYEPEAPRDASNPDFLGNSNSTIVFWDLVDGSADLFIWDGSTLTNITNTANYKEYEPVSNADGTKIVYWSGETTAEPIDTTHTLTLSSGTWVKDVDFTPIVGSYWAYWTTPAATQIAVTMLNDYNGTIDLHIYNDAGNFVEDLTGPGYTGGNGQWNFFGSMPQGPNGEFVITSNAGRTDPASGRDIIKATPKSSMVYVDINYNSSEAGGHIWGYDAFNTIQAGINAVAAGGTVNVAAGTYTLSSTLDINKSLTISGESESGVIINATAVSGYGIAITADDTTLQNLTLLGPAADADSSYGIKASHLNNLTVRNVTVQGSGRSEVDLNTVSGGLLENITADGSNTKGVGIALSHSNGISLRNITTGNNQWGGVGLFDTIEGATTGIIYEGTNIFGEQNKIYIDAENGFGASNITLPPGFGWAVKNTAFRPEGPTRSDDFTFFQDSQDNAIAFALALQSAPFPSNSASYIQTVGAGAALENNFIVGSGMSIQTAVNAAAAGSTVNVAAGTYNERITISKPLTLLGATHGINKKGYTVPEGYNWDTNVESIINNPTPVPTGLVSVVLIQDTDDVIFDGFIVQSLNAPSGSQNDMLVTITAETHTVDNISIINNVIGPNTNITYQDGDSGRMGLYIDVNQYLETPYGLVNSLIANNKIFGCDGDGDNIFIWGAYYSYGARHPSPMEGTYIQDNEIYGSHRSGIETAGGISGLTIKGNDIYGNSGLPADPDILKYGSGITLVRGSSDRTETGLGPVNVTIDGNIIHDNQKHGIYLDPNNKDIYIINNTFYGNGYDTIVVDLIGHYFNLEFDLTEGPYTNLGGSENVVVYHNQIDSNGVYGITVTGTPTNGFFVNAARNYWGVNDGATIRSLVSGKVIYAPWYTDASMTTTASDLPVHNTSQDTYHATIQEAIDFAAAGDTINITADVTEGQVIINKNLTITGDPAHKPVIQPSVSLTNTNVAGAWFLVQSGVTFNLNNVVIDGNDKWIFQAIRSHGNSTIENVDFRNIQGSFSGNPYRGVAIESFGGTIPGGAGSDTHSGGGATSHLIVNGCTFQQIGRIGILVKGTGATAAINNITYTGKGDIDCLDYGVEAGAGGTIEVTNSTITNNLGVASTDGSTSAGILVTDYYGTGTQAIITENVLTGNTAGIAAGYLDIDVSVVEAHRNDLSGNEYGISSTNPVVNANDNWWGSVNGPTHAGNTFNINAQGAAVSDFVNYAPWLNSGVDTEPLTPGFQPATGTSFAPVTNGSNVYASIQAAIDAATNGDTISVAAGTYNESVTVKKSIKLVGAGSNETIWRGNTITDRSLLIVRDSTSPANILVEITGFSFETEKNQSIRADWNTSYAQALMLDIHDNCFKHVNTRNPGTDFGLYVDGANQTPRGLTGAIRVYNNTFDIVTGGVLFEYCRAVDVIDNTFNVTYEGVTFNYYSNSGEVGEQLVKNNVFTHHKVDWAFAMNNWHGSGTYTVLPSVITDNIITGPDFSYAILYGVQASQSQPHNFTISGNALLSGTILVWGDYANQVVLNASGNWWGSTHSPHARINTAGTVDYSPWWGADYTNDNHSSAWTWYTNDSIQEAIDAAAAGDTINVAAGTYNENVIVNKSVSLIGSLTGTALATYIAPVTNTPVISITVSGISPTEPLLIKNLHVKTDDSGADAGKMTGIYAVAPGVTLSNIRIENVTVVGNNHAYPGLESGFSLSPDTSLTGLTIIGCTFKDLSYGIISGAITSSSPGVFENVKIIDTVLENNSSKGFYTERLSDAEFTNVTVINNGNIDLSASWADDWNAGIDINLKYGDYENITFNNLTVTGNGIGSANGVGLTVKARGTGNDTSYSSRPATLNGVTITGGIFSGNEYGIRFGEPGKDNTVPTGVQVHNATITGNTQKDIINVIAGVQVDATLNYWGTAVSTEIEAKISGNVEYVPWYTDATKTTTSGTKTVTILDIAGVTAPVTGAVPVSQVTETAQYFGTVTWSPAGARFLGDTVYTATITLTAKPGYTFSGVAANSFTVAGATATNAADSGVVTAVFPATGPATLQSISVSPATATIAKGSTMQFTATGRYSDGTTRTLTDVTWSSDNNGIATVNSSGLATAVATGSTTILATSGAVNGGAAINVTAPSLLSIAIEGAATANAGVPITLTVRGYYSDGSNDIITTGIFWTSQTPAIATVSSTGEVNGRLKGNNATIKATVSGFTDTHQITIADPVLNSITVLPNNPKLTDGSTLQFTAVGNYSDGSTATLTAGVTWTSSDETKATIVAGTGLATGVDPGTTTITATAGGKSGTTVLTVSAATLESITITPATADVPRGKTRQYTATGTYSDSSTVDITSMVTWSSSNTGVATINAAGLATAVAATGTSNIVATLSGVTSNTAVLTARAAEVVSITITPGNTTVPLGRAGGTQFRDYTATGTYSDGTTAVIPGASLTWTITNGTGAATVTGNKVIGTAMGTVTVNVQHTTPVTGTVINASTGLTVTAKVLDSIAITDGTATVAAGGTINLTATGTYSDGSTGAITNSVTWFSSNAGVGFMNAAGVFKSTAPGVTNITASLSGKTSPAYTITVTPATVISITVDPTGAVIPAGTTRSFRAIATKSDGSKEVVAATWTSTDTSKATVNDSGVVTGVAVGSATIRASYSGINGEITVNITTAVLDSIAITPNPGTVVSGKTQQFTATGTYSDLSTADITNMVLWSVSDTARATVNQAGLVTGRSIGAVTVTATLGGKTGTVTVTVTPATLESIVVTPANPSVTLVSGTVVILQFTATGVYSDGTTVNLTNTASWTSSVPGVAANPVNGLATAAAAGATTISATSGGKTGTTTLTVLADTVAPVVNITSPKEGLTTGNRNVIITGRVNDINATIQLIVNGGAPVALTLDANGDFSKGVTLNDGNNTILVRATDPAGNTGKSGTITVKVDPVKPVITITSPADGLLTNSKDITITGTATGTTSVNVIVNGVSTTITVTGGTFTTTATLAAGTNVICATGYATGFDGDASYLGTSGVHTVRVDTTPPVVIINNPVNNSVVSVSSQTITGSIDDPQVTTARLSLNGGAPVTVTVVNGNFSAVVNLTTGANTISVIATDAAGNSSSSATLATVIFDTSKPVVTLTSPANNLRTNAASQTIAGTVNDPTIQTVTLRINGTAETIAVVPDGANGVFSTVKTLPEGINTIEVLATNRALPPTTGSSGIITVTVDTTPPVVAISLSDPTDTIRITVTSSEDLQGVPTVDVSGANVPMSIDGIRQWTGTYNIPGNGQYTVTASVVGIAGNRATATASFARDAMAGESSKTVVSEETTLQVETTGDVTGEISVSTHMESFSGNSQTPEGAGNSAGAFVEINASPDILNNLAGIYVEVSYDPAQLPPNTDESTLRLYLWDVTTGTWQVVPGSGVDTVRHVIYATLTHLSQYGSFGSTVPTPEPPTPPAGGGVGGGLGGLPNTPGTTNIRGIVSPTGRFNETVIAYTIDKICSLYIPAGTIGLDKNLNPLNEITMLANDAPATLPQGWSFIGLAYDFGPGGASFDPAITLTWKFKPEDLPEGVNAADLALAYYDEESGQWIVLESTVDTVRQQITAKITHFSTFAVVSIQEAAAFSISALRISPAEITAGGTATATVTVTNTGNKEGSYTVVLLVNGVKKAEKTVTIPASSSLDVSFAITEQTTGTYTIALSGLSGSLKVTSQAVPEPTPTVEPEPVTPPEPEATPTQPAVTTPVPTPAPEPPKPTNWAMIWGIVAAAAVLLIGIPIYIWVRRRRD